MDLTGDFFVGMRVSRVALFAGLAAATGRELRDVRPVEAAAESGDDARIFVITIQEDAAGDFPGQYIVNANERIVEGFDAIAGRLAQRLRVPVLSAGGDDDPDIMLLSLPDGTAHRVLAEQDDDGGIRNTPEMRALIAAHPPRLDPARAA